VTVRRDVPEAPRLDELLWQVGTRSARLAETALARTPLTPSSLRILEAVHADLGTTVAELSRGGIVSPQAVRQIVARLEQRGLVERRTREGGRGVALFATEAGEVGVRQAKARRGAYEEQLIAALGRPRYRELVELLAEARDALAGSVPMPRRG
jgi:DNA-binding MarR family transcriptional regulator